MKETHKNTNLGIALGVCFGITFGLAVFDNISLGMLLGMAIGISFGAAKDKKINDQLKTQGYTITDITWSDTQNTYDIRITNKHGEMQTITIAKGSFDAESLTVGDAVYLTEEGLLEQAYDKDE